MPDVILFDGDAKETTLIQGTACAPEIVLRREAGNNEIVDR